MDQEEVVRTLRSCLISSKGGVRLECLKRDYNVIVGEPLPFKRLGFPTIEDFIYSIHNITLTKKNGEFYVEAKPTTTSAHLSKLISRQVSRQRTRRKAKQSQIKHWNPRPAPKTFFPGLKNNGPQSARNSTQRSMNSYTKPIPGKSNLQADYSSPPPLMGTVVQCPIPQMNERPRPLCDIPCVSPKRLKDKVMNPNVSKVNQSLNKSNINEELKKEVLFKKAPSPAINDHKPKTIEQKPPKLTDRLKLYMTQLPPNNNDIYSPVPNEAKTTDDPRKELEIRAKELNLSPPSYNIYNMKKEKSNPAKVTIYASVKIGEYTICSFPEDATSEEQAEKIAARLALFSLAKESLSPEVITIDQKLVKERILKIINRHHNGVFMHQLHAYYNECHGEALPPDWRKIIEECPDISQEKGAGNSTILRLAVSTAKPSVDANIPSGNSFNEFGSFSKDKIQLSPIGPVTPAKSKILEANSLWKVYTTCVISTVEVWVRLVDDNYNDNFCKMKDEMNDYYNVMKKSMPTSMSTCILGDFYAVLDEDNHWHRVQCIDCESHTDVTVFFIDGGYEDQYECDLLYPLEKKFCILPAQAVRVSLQGLEGFRECTQAVTEIENYLMDQEFQMKVHRNDLDEDSSFATVTFYNTSEKDRIDVNTILFNNILTNFNEASKLQVGELVELYVMHVNMNGRIYTQLNSPARACLQNVLNNEAMSQVPVNIMKNSLVKTIDFTKMYLAQINSQWYRVKVTDIQHEFEVTVFLIDIGRTTTTLRGNLIYLDKISNILQHISPQATQIFLHDIDQSMFNERLVTRFNKLVSETDLLLAKVVRVTTSNIPVVVIFKRLESSNMLASINSTLIYEGGVIKSNEDGNNNIKPKKRSERKSSHFFDCGQLNPPTISGTYFDVRVSLAANPGNFIVQPLNSMDELKEMMFKLQKCNTCKELPLESISEGKLYAGKLDDFWYRVYVTNIMSDNLISVYLCDFGNVVVMQPNCLQPLKSEFINLPYQAVKAKLIGIEPMNADWSVDDCVRFRDLVLEKNFVSIVSESISDDYSPANGTVLGLRLIDVSTDEDVFIDRLLVDERRAKVIKPERSSD